MGDCYCMHCVDQRPKIQRSFEKQKSIKTDEPIAILTIFLDYYAFNTRGRSASVNITFGDE